MTGTGTATTINIQCIVTNELWIGAAATHCGSGPMPGILDEDGDYILDENGNRIVAE